MVIYVISLVDFAFITFLRASDPFLCRNQQIRLPGTLLQRRYLLACFLLILQKPNPVIF